jgi:hypothetical protein
MRVSNQATLQHGNCIGPKKASPTYLSWVAAKSRCYDKKDNAYADYGGRGIAVCDRWRDDFQAFLADMGERPEGMTLDRYPDVNGPYSPDNCRWATWTQQANNKRSNVLIEHGGETKTVAQVAREVGMRPSVLASRLRNGWSIERATTEPVRSK